MAHSHGTTGTMVNPAHTSYEVWWSAVSSLSGVTGGASVAKSISIFWDPGYVSDCIHFGYFCAD